VFEYVEKQYRLYCENDDNGKELICAEDGCTDNWTLDKYIDLLLQRDIEMCYQIIVNRK
jgi:hypothetical protein